MIRNGILTVSTLISVVLFPWPLSVLLALGASFFEPLVPLSAGLLADTLYFAPGAGGLPVYTLYGLVVSVVAVFVRSQMRTGTMR